MSRINVSLLSLGSISERSNSMASSRCCPYLPNFGSLRTNIFITSFSGDAVELFSYSPVPKNKFLFKNTNNINIITNHKFKYFSEIIISQTSSLIYDFLRIKKKFSVISFDYKSDLISKRILQKIKPISKDKDMKQANKLSKLRAKWLLTRVDELFYM